MIALDLDGTLLDYSPEGPFPKINPAALAALSAALDRRPRQVAILTNQGGCPGGRWACCPEDARAAANAGIPFYYVERFL